MSSADIDRISGTADGPSELASRHPAPSQGVPVGVQLIWPITNVRGRRRKRHAQSGRLAKTTRGEAHFQDLPADLAGRFFWKMKILW